MGIARSVCKTNAKLAIKNRRESQTETEFRETLSFLLCEVFAIAKVKLLRSEVRAIARVKLSLPSLRRRRNFTHEVNFTIEDNFTCPQGQT